jgi:hypothetical protein
MLVYRLEATSKDGVVVSYEGAAKLYVRDRDFEALLGATVDPYYNM